MAFAARLMAGCTLAVYLVAGYPPLIDSYSNANDFQFLKELNWTHAVALLTAAWLLGGILRDIVWGRSALFLQFRPGEPPVSGDPALISALGRRETSWTSDFYWLSLNRPELEAFRKTYDTGHIDLVFGDG